MERRSMHESDVNFLRRAFPLFPTAVVVTLAVAGHLFPKSCLDGLVASSPVWYFVNYQVVFYPFLVLWPSPRLVFPFTQSYMALIAVSLSLCLALVEAGATLAGGSKSIGWAASYSLHVLTLLLLVVYHRHERRKDMEDLEASDYHLSSSLALGVTSMSVIFSLLSSWDYDTARNNFFQGVVIYLLLPMQGMALLCLDRKNPLRFSHSHCVFYAVLGMRVPDFLAFGSVRLFANFDQHGFSMISGDALRYLVSTVYLAFMALYLRLLKKVTELMGAPDIFPRFLFHVQFYCYSCYYVLVSTAREIDVLFFFMLVLMNVYYVLNNTGVITELMDRYLWSKCEPRHSAASFRSGGASETPEWSKMVAMAYSIKFAEQDFLADSSALLAIPTLITVFASLAARDALKTADALSAKAADGLEVVSIRVEHYDGVPLDLINLWARFGLMFLARFISMSASKRVFACRLQASFLAFSERKSPLPRSNPSTEEEGIHLKPRDPLNVDIRQRTSSLEREEQHLSDDKPLLIRRQLSIFSPDKLNEAAEYFTDEALRRTILGLAPTSSLETIPPSSAARAMLAASVDQFQNAVIAAEFPNVLPYFILVCVHSLYSLFQNPDLPTRYAFCSSISVQ